MEFTLDEIETNLRLLCDIKQNEKLVIEGNYIKIDDRYFLSIRRWWNEDERDKILFFLGELINSSKKYYIEMVSEIKNCGNSSKQNYNRLCTLTYLIQESRDGLTNISLTYVNDKLLKSKIETIKREINYIVSEFINTGKEFYN